MVSELGMPRLIGKTVGEAAEYCLSEVPGGWIVRVTRRDGALLPVTRDYRTDRINVAVVDGIIRGQQIG